MNVLYDYTIFCQQQYGGVSRLFCELINRMGVFRNIKIFFFQGFHINRYPFSQPAQPWAYYFGKQVTVWPHISLVLNPLNRFLFTWQMHDKPIEIYHPSHYSSSVSTWRKSPVVLTVNDMIPELFPHHFADIRIRLKIKRANIERADHIIAISQQTKKDLQDYYNIPGQRISVIYPGAPLALSDQELEKAKSSVSPNTKPYILYVGTRKQEYKNFKRLLFAYSAMSKELQHGYDLLCFGGPPFTSEERHFIAKLGCTAQVKHVSGDDLQLALFYQYATVFVYPSLYEGFGLSPLEAMAYHCPVLASQVSVLPEILSDAAGYFNPLEPSSIATALEHLLTNCNLRQSLVKKGIKNLEKFCWSNMSKKVYNVYASLIKPEV